LCGCDSRRAVAVDGQHGCDCPRGAEYGGGEDDERPASSPPGLRFLQCRQRRRPAGERRVVPQDRALQLAKRGARLEPELFVEHPSCIPVGLECIHLPPVSVEREDQLSPKTLAQRVVRDQARELRNELFVPTGLEIGIKARFDRCQSQLLERARLSRGKRRFETIERHAVPELVGAAKESRPFDRVTQSSRFGEQRANLVQVELARLDLDRVAVPRRRNPPTESATKARYVRLYGGHPAARRLIPELVQQALGRGDLIPVQQEVGQKRALSRSPEPERLTP
jgi:hypothetical protein